MTFSSIKQTVMGIANLTSQEADRRVGESINQLYKQLTAELGLDPTRFVTRTQAMTLGVATLTVTNIEKIDRVYDTSDNGRRELVPVSITALRRDATGTSQPTRWALQSVTATTVTILTDTVPQTAYTLQADGMATLADLEGEDVPVIAESYHHVLTWAVLSDELLRKEKDKLAGIYKLKSDELLGKLRQHYVDYPAMTRQGEQQAPSAGVSGSSGSGTLGGTNYTQSGLVTFDRDPDAPFAVTPGSAYVPNLYAEGIGNVASDRLIGRDTAGTGESEQITVGGGLGFTGVGGIEIQNDAVTYAKMQNVSAASRVLGRGSAAGAGNVEELSLASSLALSGTTLSTDASIVPYTATGAGAVARTVKARFDDVLNVKDFGALGNGSNDDTAEIQAALDVAAATGRRSVFFPAGIYVISDTLILDTTNSYMHLVGAGSGATVIQAADNFNANVIEIGDETEYWVDVTLEGLFLHGRSDDEVPGSGNTTGSGIVQQGGHHVRYIDVTVFAMPEYGIHNIGAAGGSFSAYAKYRGVHVASTGKHGIWWDDGCFAHMMGGSSALVNCGDGTLANLWAGLRMNDGDSHRVMDVNFDECDWGIVMANVRDVAICGTLFTNMGAGSISFFNGNNERVSVTGFSIIGGSKGSSGTYDAISITSANGNERIVVANGTIKNTDATTWARGIVLDVNATNCVIDNISIEDASSTDNLVLSLGADNRIQNIIGQRRYAYGATSVADGGTIAHGLYTTPTVVRVTPTTSGEFVSVTAKGTTTFTCAIKKHDNTAGTTQVVYWEAEV